MNDIVVFDPFLGSGTTALAAKHLGMSYIGFEINEKYFNIAKDRLQGINQKGEMNLFDIDYD
jgi:site-specific DNA-methyltransferase (adenine-specific)